MGKKFLGQVGLSMSSVRLGIKVLVEKDMICRVKLEDKRLLGIKIGQYRVLDPLLTYALRRYS